jgi:hypothetical protein
MTTLDEKEVPVDNSVVLSQMELSNVVGKIQWAAMVNRVLYSWAYRLQNYRQSQLTMVLNTAAYIGLFLGTALTFALVNLALLTVDASQYTFAEYPSTIAMCSYGVSTLFWGEAGSVAPAGDLAHALATVAGLFTLIVLTILAANFLFTLRRTRDDSALTTTVEQLKSEARKQERQFREGMRVGIAEACARLSALGHLGMLAVLDRLMDGIPPDFLEDPTEPL